MKFLQPVGELLVSVQQPRRLKSDRSEFIVRPVSCKRKGINVWRPILTRAGLL